MAKKELEIKCNDCKAEKNKPCRDLNTKEEVNYFHMSRVTHKVKG